MLMLKENIEVTQPDLYVHFCTIMETGICVDLQV